MTIDGGFIRFTEFYRVFFSSVCVCALIHLNRGISSTRMTSLAVKGVDLNEPAAVGSFSVTPLVDPFGQRHLYRLADWLRFTSPWPPPPPPPPPPFFFLCVCVCVPWPSTSTGTSSVGNSRRHFFEKKDLIKRKTLNVTTISKKRSTATTTTTTTTTTTNNNQQQPTTTSGVVARRANEIEMEWDRVPDEETISTLSLSLSLSLSFVLEHPESRKEKQSENQQPRPTFTGFSLPSFFFVCWFFFF